MTGLMELLEAMLMPETYPDPTSEVALVQTQMSLVFLTDNYVYKVKKPVNLGYLDYTTLEKRHLYCHKEVELNRRLCPDVYLGVVPLTSNGKVSLEGKGAVMEYAVKMLRLPQEAMLNILLENGRVSLGMIASVAQKMAQFHQQAETSKDISTFGNIASITTNWEENFTQTEKYLGNTISRVQFQRIKVWTEKFLKRNDMLLLMRVQEGKIRDCHGDLHAAHVCFFRGIAIYDCIEFNDRFRYCDVASEIAFLAMDLDHYGCTELSQTFVDAYVKESQDKGVLVLMDFYKCYRAYVRGKVHSFMLDDPLMDDEEKARAAAAARSYFELAASYTSSKREPAGAIQ